MNATIKGFAAILVTLLVTACPTDESFLRAELNDDRFTDNSADERIVEFQAATLQKAEQYCDARMPAITDQTMGGGIESSCLDDVANNTFRCICVLKLYRKGSEPFVQHSFYLRSSE